VAWICWAPPYDQLPPNPQLEQLIPDFAPVFTSDNQLVQRQAAEAGLGAIMLGNVRHRFQRASTLVPLKLDLGPSAESAIYLVCAKSALEIPRVRIVAELLAQELSHLHVR
jgi:DNA-binding transcriptional LysR family regulator